MALARDWIPSPNYSSRGGARVRLIVVHTAEGALTYESLGNYFKSSSVQASSHVGIDDTPGRIGEYVHRNDKAWTQAEFNPVSVSVELCAFAAWDSAEWHRHPTMLQSCAAWIAEEAAHWGIPITRLTAAQAQGSSSGVCGHADLGSRGGGHHDPGAQFPWTEVLDMARGGGPSTTEDETVVASAVSDGGSLHVFWAGDDSRTVYYRWQRRGESAWNSGGILAKAPKDIAGLSAATSATGTLELFARYTDANVAHLWQNANSTAWSGGEPGKQKASFSPLPG